MLQRILARYYPPGIILEILEDGKIVEKKLKLPKITPILDVPTLALKFVRNSPYFLPNQEQKLRSTLKKIKEMQLIEFYQYNKIKTIKPHMMPLVFACFNKGGELLLTSSYDRTARIFDTNSGRLISTFTGHSNAIRKCCFNLPVGNLIATASFDRTARIWDAASGKSLSILAGHTQEVIDVIFSSDGVYLATASLDGTARLWDVERGALIRQLDEHTGPLVSAVFSPDSLSEENYFNESQILPKTPESEDNQKTPENKDNQKNLENEEKSEINLTNLLSEDDSIEKPKVLNKYITNNSHENLLLTAACDQTARLWDMRSPDSVCVLRGHRSDLSAAIFSSNSQIIATASLDSTVRLWDIRQSIAKQVFKEHTGPVLSLAITNDGDLIATGSADGTAKLWNSSGNVLFTAPHGSEVVRISFSPQESKILTGTDNGVVQLWNVETKQFSEALSGHSDGLITAQFNYTSDMILTASKDNTAMIWKATANKDKNVVNESMK